ncbi:MAG: D-Ala-D-Ala carboxypeptidase family metallohydrolase [Gemmatimonadaceae bacterium]
MFGTAAILYVLFLRPVDGLDRFRTVARTPVAQLAMNAYGRSGAVRMHFALPGESVDFPLEVHGDPNHMRYSWLPLRNGRATEPQSLAGALVAPREPGFYRLAVLSDSSLRVFDDLPLAVIVPFSEKSGNSLNGYRIGRYRGERRPFGSATTPRGFVQVTAGDLDIRVTEHLRLADFVTHDTQSGWPRYVALDPRILDKLELVFGVLASAPSDSALSTGRVAVDVHSGFRTPLYNRRVSRSAGDSRHQYGDAADIAIDVDRNGRVNASDVRLLASAVELVEKEHPDLLGGLGVYTRNGAPYVHVDSRGIRVRWRG